MFSSGIGPRTWITVTLSGAVSFSGYAVAIDGACWIMDLGLDEDDEPTDRVWLAADKVVALIVHNHQKKPDPVSELVLRRKAMGLEIAATLEFVWGRNPPEASEVSAAWRMLKTIAEALDAFYDMETRIRTIRLMSSQGGRFRIEDGVLEAGFIEGEDPPAVRELQSLLAAIL